MMTVLVTGATGLIGRRLVDRLLSAGVGVRAVSRDPVTAALPSDVQVVAGDITAPASLSRAVEGADRMYLFSAGATAHQVVGLAREAGVRRIVVLSGLGSAQPEVLEESLSGLEWTHLQPGAFAANTRWLWAEQIRSTGVVRFPFPDAATAPIHEADIAAVAAIALLDDGHAGRRYELTGPESLTHRQQVATIGHALGHEIPFVEEPAEQARHRMLRELPEPLVDRLLARWAEASRSPAAVVTTVERVTGRAPRRFAQWAQDHVDDFA